MYQMLRLCQWAKPIKIPTCGAYTSEWGGEHTIHIKTKKTVEYVRKYMLWKKNKRQRGTWQRGQECLGWGGGGGVVGNIK